MALISTKNIISPFTNKLHLTTIILLVIAFTILRLMGGHIDVVKKGTTTKNSPYLPKQETQQQETDSKKGSSLKDLEDMFR